MVVKKQTQNIPQDWNSFSEQYDRAYRALTHRGVNTSFQVTLEGEYIPSTGYTATQQPNGRPHGYSDGVDPFREGAPHGPRNQGFEQLQGRLQKMPDMPRPVHKLRDDLEAQYQNKLRLTPFR